MVVTGKKIGNVIRILIVIVIVVVITVMTAVLIMVDHMIPIVLQAIKLAILIMGDGDYNEQVLLVCECSGHL